MGLPQCDANGLCISEMKDLKEVCQKALLGERTDTSKVVAYLYRRTCRGNESNSSCQWVSEASAISVAASNLVVKSKCKRAETERLDEWRRIPIWHCAWCSINVSP